MPVDAPVLITPAAYAKMVLHAHKHPTQPIAGLLMGKMLGSDGAAVFVTDAVPLTHTSVATLPHPIIEAGIKMVYSHAAAHGCTVVGTYFCNERMDDNAQLNELNKRLAARLPDVLASAGVSVGGGSGGGSAGSGDGIDDDRSSSARMPSQPVALLLDNVVLCDGGSECAVKVLNSQTGMPFRGEHANTRGKLLFSTWNRDTGAPNGPQAFEDARARIEAILASSGATAAGVGSSSSGKDSKKPQQQQMQIWDFEEHLEDVDSRNFLNPWIA